MRIDLHVFLHHDEHDPALAAITQLREDIAAMSASVQTKLDALTTAVSDAATTFGAVGAGISKEILQLGEIVGNGGLTSDQTAQLQASIDRLGALKTTMQTAADALAADDPAPVPTA